MDRKLKIMDWLVHGGHQYEFFKTNHKFFCTKTNGQQPQAEDLGRPRNRNVNYVTGPRASADFYDIMMVRSALKEYTYKKYRYASKGKNTPGIAVMQTHIPFKVPEWTRCIVWNSKFVMDKYRHRYPKQKHFYIPHGFDPDEFKFLNLERNKRVLSAVSVFKERGYLLGFNEWRWVSKKAGICDLLGHGNDDLKEAIGSFPLAKLVKTYNKYGVFLNTTTKSAMPRTRAESLMCGTPLVTTNNYGIERYLTHGKNCLFANTKEDMLKSVKKILSSKQMQEDLSAAGREAAIKHFHITTYIKRWNQVFEEALRR
jgi:glycosyltransferase involved in cell wall biosynthesis